MSANLRRVALARGRLLRPKPKNGHGLLPMVATTTIVGVVALFLVSGTVLSSAALHALDELQADLPDPAILEDLDFAEPTIVYDRTGTVELGRFQREERRVVSFEDVPKLVIDATTAAEDRTFWQNEGFDPAAIGSAILEGAAGEGERGASTITQQLVRARLLPGKYLEPGADRYLRKAKELLQAARLTEKFPGEPGKVRIVTAYLNQIYYGHQAYGVAAAASVYFGISDLSKLSVSQAALLAGLPKSPSTLDPYRYAVEETEVVDGETVTRLVVPRDAPPVLRRDYVLSGLRQGERWTKLSASELRAALEEPIVLAGERPLIFRAPHFTWQVKRQLDGIVADREPVETGGYRVITTLDYEAQKLAERYVYAAAVLPNLSGDEMQAAIRRFGIERDRDWLTRLRGRDVHNAAMAAVDYRTGDVVAYAGSAGYYRRTDSRKLDPKYDVAGVGFRQPGSAWKPIVYATAFETQRLTPGSLLLDVTTQFGRDSRTGRAWAPRDADLRERGPVRVRKALQYSLNIPAIRAIDRVGNEAVARQAEALGITFRGGELQFLRSGLAGAIGTVEVRLLDLVSAYGTLGNGGMRVPPRMILEVRDTHGNLVYQAGQPAATRAIGAQSAYLVTDILKGNTNPAENLIWGPLFKLDNGPNGERRPAAVKTGTTNDTRDLSAYGYIAPPADQQHPALAVGVWMGNSDYTQPLGDEPTFASDGPARVWHAFLRDFTQGWPVADFPRPDGLVQARIDAWSGGPPGPWTRDVVNELFIAGTQPGGGRAVDPGGLLYTFNCGTWQVHPLKAEPREQWRDAVSDWAARARRGAGVVGHYGSATAYFFGLSSWGGPIYGPCPPPPKPKKKDKPSPSPDGEPSPSGGGGGGHGGGGGRP
ncbi:MAG TPA: transglycosylase domain-containing protein [Candidatus Limnocylindrales bacterium]|jgi:membrane peptidoglycan carboxypeptidase|nr:transglycosylase domain-containing protein [Candidatus Limnocylindrales bacterium]